MAETGTKRQYVERGARLRARRKELERNGTLSADLDKLAGEIGVSVSAYQSWERGEYWPTPKFKPKLAAKMGWTEQELDFGPQPVSVGDPDVPSHPVSPDELEIIALYRGISDKVEAKRALLARLHAQHTLQQNMRSPLRPATDTEVEHKMPVTDKKRTLPGKKHKKT